MKKIQLIIFVLSFGVVLSSCLEEDSVREPSGHSTVIPAQVSDIGYTSLAGAVQLHYKLPNDPNIAQVQVKYTLGTGQLRTVSSSVYVDHVILDGFADTLEHEVEVYTVSKIKRQSEPVTATVVANEAGIWKVQKSLTFSNPFGGFNVNGNNPDSAIVSIFIMEENDFGDFEVNNFISFATSFQNITRKIRGLDTLSYRYKYFVMDRWENSTDTVEVGVQPFYEALIPRSGYASARLPGDAPMVSNGAAVEFAWDGRIDSWPSALFTDQVAGGGGPHMVTIDLGIECKLSRFWYRPYSEFWWDLTQVQFFFLTTMREFEVYGSVAPNSSGALDASWFLMDTFELEKPSGSPYGADTPEDVAVGQAGFDFEFDAKLPKVRYLRIRCLRNWADGTAMNIGECAFYGDPR